MAPAPASLYALLEVPQEASNEQVRQAFRNLSKRFHPDTTELPAELAAARFQALQEAMVVLGDPQKRRLYDASLRAAELNQQRLAQRFSWRPNTDPPPRRDLSGGEWFALVLLGLALGFSLVLGVGRPGGVGWICCKKRRLCSSERFRLPSRYPGTSA